MKNTFLFGSLLLIFSLFFGCNSSQTTSSISEDSALIPGELITQNILHNGDEREYQLYLPSSYNEGTAYPVLLNFHGFGGNAKDYFAYESNFQEVADQEAVILVYPQALLLSGFSVWNAAPFAEDNKTDFDDIGFIEFDNKDVVRNPLVSKIVNKYEKFEKDQGIGKEYILNSKRNND